MGLRINTNVGALTALRNLRQADRAQQSSIERLSTGLRINSAADDPSGLVISERLRAQINSLEQAAENTQNAKNLVTTADSALQEAQNLLSDIKDSIVFAMNDGSSSPDQLQAEQDSVDAAISALNRIANTTRFAGKNLLNGNAEFNVSSSTPEIVNDLTIREMQFPQGVQSQQFEFDVTQSATRGHLNIGSVAADGDVTIRVTGERGSEEVILESGTGSAAVASAINNVAGETGVFASNISASNNHALTEEFGEDEQVKIEVLDDSGGSGIQINGAAQTEGDILISSGQDPEINLNGQQFTGDGRHFKIVSNFANFEFNLDSDTGTSGVETLDIDTSITNQTISVERSGLQFQLNEKAQVTDQITIGIESINSSKTGFDTIPDVIASALSGNTVEQGGFLDSLKSGNDNDLFSDPENASKIVDDAISQISRLRGHLGATEAFNFQPNQDHLSVAIENLKSSESQIRDLDFAKESARFTRNQVLFQAGTAVLASANQVPQSVLSLLQ